MHLTHSQYSGSTRKDNPCKCLWIKNKNLANGQVLVELWTLSGNYLSITLQQLELSLEERSERYGPLQQHRRAVASLNKQIQQKIEQLEEVSILLLVTLPYHSITNLTHVFLRLI